jgi:hypothetical protein
MGLFGTPTLAQIYVKELKTRLDSTLVPLFAPDEDVRIGTIGSFDKGQFVSSNVTIEEEFGIGVQTTLDETPSDWVFASEGAVKLSAEGTMSAAGVDLLKGTLSFSRDRAVVASFKGVTATTAKWTTELNRQVWELYLAGRLAKSSVVVWTVRSAASGTVVVSRKSGTNVDIAADPSLLGGVLSLQGIGAGVTFTGGQQAAVQLTGPSMTPFVRTKGAGGARLDTLVDVKGFEQDPAAALDALGGLDVPDLEVDSALGEADWDEPEVAAGT